MNEYLEKMLQNMEERNEKLVTNLKAMMVNRYKNGIEERNG